MTATANTPRDRYTIGDLAFPQPIGIAPFPQGLMLISDEADRQRLLLGVPPEKFADAGIAAAYAGDLDAARDAFEANLDANPRDYVSAFNLYVLDNEEVDVEGLKRALPKPVDALIDVVEFVTTQTDVPVPALSQLPPEIQSIRLATEAVIKLENDDLDGCLELLNQGVEIAVNDSPTLAALTLDSIARQYQLLDQPTLAIEALARAIYLLDHPLQRHFVAKLQLQRGLLLEGVSQQQPGLIEASAEAFVGALDACDADQDPEVFATAHLHLAAICTNIPTDDPSAPELFQSAFTSLTAAREVFAQLDDAHNWATATADLANAYVYVPATPEVAAENYAHAVALFQDALAVRSVDSDPFGHAYLQLNYSNALGLQGKFADALTAAQTAQSLFQTLGDTHGQGLATELVDNLAQFQR